MKTQKLVLASQIFLRMVAIAAALAATLVIVTSNQTVVVYGLTFDAKYSYSPAFKFFAFANAFACCFTFLSLFFLLFSARRGLTPSNYYLLFLHDLFMMSLVLSGVAAGTAIGYVGQYGNSHIGWFQICDRMTKFCQKVSISILFSYVTVMFLLVLTIISASKSREIRV